MSPFKPIFILSILLILILSNVLPAQVYEMSTKELTETSSAIVVGECVEKESYWNEKHDKIFTRVKIRVDQTIKGDEGAEAEVLLPGGRVGNVIYEVSDMPVFDEGEESLVFIWKHPSGKNLVTGALNGKLKILKDKKTGEKLIKGGTLISDEIKDHDHKAALKSRSLNKYVEEIKGYLKK